MVALSECAAHIEKAFLADFKPYQEAIEKKLIVLHPPQKLIVHHFTDKNISLDGAIKFLFVGNAFFRKGGKEIVETFLDIKERFGYPIELIIVSSFDMDTYAAHETEKDSREIKSLIKQNTSWITHFAHLPNTEVLGLMKGAHVGLLPTYADTYGFSVLEFQASGCPVISTNIRALPEINNNDAGWLIDVPKSFLGEAYYSTSAERHTLSQSIRQGLERVLHEIFGNREIIAKKSNLAIQRIQEHHDPRQFGANLKDVYLEAIQK